MEGNQMMQIIRKQLDSFRIGNAKQALEIGLDLRIKVIGMDLDDEQVEELNCIIERLKKEIGDSHAKGTNGRDRGLFTIKNIS